jgi:hypothetical protein
MGNISIANEKTINEFRNKNESINQLKSQIIKYNTTQTGSHSVGINTKSNKNKNKNCIPENQEKNLRNTCNDELNTKIFRFIFPPPENNSFHFRETINLRLGKEAKNHFHTNTMPKNNNYLDIIADSLL